MEPLDLLWELESQWSVLDSCKTELERLKDDLEVKAIERKIASLNKKLNNYKNKQDKSKIKLTQLEKKLKINIFNIEELEKELYDGHTSDIKQLEYLNDEKNKVRNLIDKIEVEILEIMGTLEDEDQESKQIENELDDIIDENSDMEDRHKLEIKKIEVEIESSQEKIIQMEKKIDPKLINEYNRIRESRGTGIAELKDSICMGCNIKIPTFFMEKIKNTKGIFHCESCGRILYHKF